MTFVNAARLAALFAAASVAGCASDPSGQNDPYEQTNRSFFAFDQGFDVTDQVLQKLDEQMPTLTVNFVAPVAANAGDAGAAGGQPAAPAQKPARACSTDRACSTGQSRVTAAWTPPRGSTGSMGASEPKASTAPLRCSAPQA